MVRIGLVIAVIGGVVGYFGFNEYRVSRGAASEPVAVDLAKIEANQAPETNYVKIGPHIAVYGATIYTWQKPKHSTEKKPSPTTKLTTCYYPILSPTHPFLAELDNLVKKHQGNVPDNLPIPEISSFSVLVKTNRFDTLSAIPEDLQSQNSVQGLIINQIHSLSSKEKELIKSNFPKADTDKILILEDGREPASLGKSMGMMGAGAAGILVGLAVLIVGATKS